MNPILLELGTYERPIRATKAEIERFLAWRTPLDKRLEELPISEQQDFIMKCRADCRSRWPKFFPNAIVEIID